MMADVKPFVGNDVAKAQLDVAIGPNGESFSLANDESGMAAGCLDNHKSAGAERLCSLQNNPQDV
jgi:hypothetical protein